MTMRHLTLLLLVASVIPAVFSFTCKVPGTFPSTTTCKEYYVCHTNNELQVVMCPYGTFFDPSINSCNAARSIECTIQEKKEDKPWWKFWKRQLDGGELTEAEEKEMDKMVEHEQLDEKVRRELADMVDNSKLTDEQKRDWKDNMAEFELALEKVRQEEVEED